MQTKMLKIISLLVFISVSACSKPANPNQVEIDAHNKDYREQQPYWKKKAEIDKHVENCKKQNVMNRSNQ